MNERDHSAVDGDELNNRMELRVSECFQVEPFTAICDFVREA